MCSLFYSSTDYDEKGHPTMKNKVALITTGGTIASRKTESGRLAAGAISGTELAEICKLPEDVQVDVYPTFQLPSMHITFQDLLQLKSAIEKVFEDDTYDGAVVTHGTDSLEETAYFLDLTIRDVSRLSSQAHSAPGGAGE